MTVFHAIRRSFTGNSFRPDKLKIIFIHKWKQEFIDPVWQEVIFFQQTSMILDHKYGIMKNILFFLWGMLYNKKEF
jgi:hypothetical protein